MKVTIQYNEPIGNFKAIGKTETSHAIQMWEAPGTSLVYFRTDRFNVRSVAKSEIISVEGMRGG